MGVDARSLRQRALVRRDDRADSGREAAGCRAGRSDDSRSSRPDARKKSSQQASRRRQPPRRAPLPAAKRELLISVDIGEQRIAILEDDRVAEVYLERPERRSIAGNIYLGVVDNVLPGMEAAFVEIGLEKNGFLYVDEIVVPELEGKRHGKKIQDLISRGEKLLVQAVKDPMKTKGARLTTEISLPGRFLVFVPNGEGLGVSRRLDDTERARLKDILKAIDARRGRRHRPHRRRGRVRRGHRARPRVPPAAVEDDPGPLEERDRAGAGLPGGRASAADRSRSLHRRLRLGVRRQRPGLQAIVGYLKKTSPHMLERVHRDKEKRAAASSDSASTKEIASTLKRRVDLPSGGYLVFDYAEAFTVIDVNTGRFVGSRSKTSTQRLEDTITKNNLEAVKEVVRQLRLRDIGGIIVIDFIDMANPKNRQAVEEALRHELERDRTKTYVVEISPLGLVEMTRQNVDGRASRGHHPQVPDVCRRRHRRLGRDDGDRSSSASSARSRPPGLAHASRPTASPSIHAGWPCSPAPEENASRSSRRRPSRRFFLVAGRGPRARDHFEVLAEGKLDDLRPGARRRGRGGRGRSSSRSGSTT